MIKKTNYVTAIVMLVMLAQLNVTAAEERTIEDYSQQAVNTYEDLDFYVGINGQYKTREMKIGNQKLDVNSTVIRLAGNLNFDWIKVMGELGTAKAEIKDIDADGNMGLSFLLGADARMLKFTFSDDAYFDVNAKVTMDYNLSNFSDDDFYWVEFQFVPYIKYVQTMSKDDLKFYDPLAYSMSVGFIGSFITGDMGGANVSETGNFGLYADLGLLCQAGTLLEFYGELYGGDYTAGIKFGYEF